MNFDNIKKIIIGKIKELKNNLSETGNSFHSGAILRYFRWTKADTYIMKRFFLALFGSLFLFVFIYEMTQVFNSLRWLPKNADMGMFLKAHVLESLYWVIILQPFSFLFATVFVLSSLTRTNELVALISTGTSIYRISIYMVLFSIAYYLLMVFVLSNLIIFPLYQRSMILLKVARKEIKMAQLERLKNNRNFSAFGSNYMLYIVSYYNATAKELTGVTVEQYSAINSGKNKIQLPEKITNRARIWMLSNVNLIEKSRELKNNFNITIRMRIDAQKAIWNMKTKKWIFYNGKVRYVDNGGTSFRVESFKEKSFDQITDPPSYFERMWYNVDAMTISEARAYIARKKKAHMDVGGIEARYLSKYSYPLGVIFVVLAGIGIVNIASRKTSVIVINFVISFVLFLVYYIFFVVGLSLAAKGSVTPFGGAFTGSVVFILFSSYLYIRAKT